MDPLSEIIALLKPHAIVSKPISGSGDWGVKYSEYGEPSYAIVLEGTCHLSLEGGESVQLESGDFVLFPVTPAFTFSNRTGVECIEVIPSNTAVHYGDDTETDFRMLGGAFQVDKVNSSLLLDLLPTMIHIRATEESTSRLAQVIALIKDECESDWPGRDLILERLLEVVLIESLRWQRPDENSVAKGLLAGMRHPGLCRALRAMHSDVSVGWTVAELGRHAGMSRSVFAAQFQKVIGCSPIEYLSRWRMALAQDALCRGDITLERLAQQIGYDSASAFSTAFRKRIGCAPGMFSKSQKGEGALSLMAR